MASAPFSYLEEAEGAHRILGSSQVFEVPINNTVVAVREDVLEAHPDVAAALTTCVEKAQDTLASDHGKAATYLASASGGKQSAQSIRADLAEEDLVWPSKTNGIEPVATFMQELGLIDDVPPTPDVLYGG